MVVTSETLSLDRGASSGASVVPSRFAVCSASVNGVCGTDDDVAYAVSGATTDATAAAASRVRRRDMWVSSRRTSRFLPERARRRVGAMEESAAWASYRARVEQMRSQLTSAPAGAPVRLRKKTSNL